MVILVVRLRRMGADDTEEVTKPGIAGTCHPEGELCDARDLVVERVSYSEIPRVASLPSG